MSPLFNQVMLQYLTALIINFIITCYCFKIPFVNGVLKPVIVLKRHLQMEFYKFFIFNKKILSQFIFYVENRNCSSNPFSLVNRIRRVLPKWGLPKSVSFCLGVQGRILYCLPGNISLTNKN